MTSTLVTLGLCLLVTLVLEEGLALILGARSSDLLVILLCNTLTNPAAVGFNAVLTQMAGVPVWVSLLVLEAVVVLVEGLIYSRLLTFRKVRPMVLSLLLNTVSFVVGSAAVWGISQVL